MADYDIKILGGVILVLVFLLLIGAIWLGSILLREAEDIKAASKNVQSAFHAVDIEITRKLKNNRAIHFADLLRIVEKVSNLIPGVRVELEKDFERNKSASLLKAMVSGQPILYWLLS